MADQPMTLAGEFPPVTHEEWLAAVDKVLRGKPFDAVLQSETRDGTPVEPLYTLDQEQPVDQVPSRGASRRASRIDGITGGWDIRQRHLLTAVAEANDAILTDLQRGVTSIELDMNGIDSLATLDAVLAEVLLDLAPVALSDAADPIAAAELFLALADQRGVPSGELAADLGCDPIGALMATGSAGASVDDVIAQAAELGARVSTAWPRVRTWRADGAPAAAAGATPATELAVTVSSGVAYARALVAAGLEPASAFGQILLAVSVGTEQFADIAKLRALRIIWGRICEASGVADQPAVVQASTSEAVLAQRDPWVNMLRTTIGCFAAAVGGADIVLVCPFDSQVGVPDQLGLRVARNTQLTLLEETNLHRVIDPAGGSWYVEAATDALADAAWARFQEIERAGGIVASLRAGDLQAQISADADTLRAAVGNRSRPITGVSEFPAIDEALLERPAYPARAGTGVPEVEPLSPFRLAADFEALRDRADAGGTPPTVYLANLGPVADHTARATWAKNFFEAGGIRAIDNDGTEPAAVAADFVASGARLAVICSSDAIYAEQAADAATVLKASGAARVYLAGRPGDLEDQLREAGVDTFVFAGGDVLSVLTDAHDLLGTEALS